jgi:hypothetical protein
MSIEKSNDALPISDKYQRSLEAISETYDRGLITNLAKDLTLSLRRGFSRSNVIRFRQFYLCYPKGATLSHLLR